MTIKKIFRCRRTIHSAEICYEIDVISSLVHCEGRYHPVGDISGADAGIIVVVVAEASIASMPRHSQTTMMLSLADNESGDLRSSPSYFVGWLRSEINGLFLCFILKVVSRIRSRFHLSGASEMFTNALMQLAWVFLEHIYFAGLD